MGIHRLLNGLKRKTKAETNEFVLEITAATVFQFLFRQYHVRAADFHKDNSIFFPPLTHRVNLSRCCPHTSTPTLASGTNVTKKFFVCQICISFLLSYKSLHDVCCINMEFLVSFSIVFGKSALSPYIHVRIGTKARCESFSPKMQMHRATKKKNNSPRRHNVCVYEDQTK